MSGNPDSAFTVRIATHADVPSLRELIAASVRGLSVGYYSAPQIEAALTAVFGVDTLLIDDGSYYVIDGPEAPIASGGWSARRTLFGGDQMKSADDPRLDPRTEAARIRAFFVDPKWSRRGLARMLYESCAAAARAAGFARLELMSTLPGEPLYLALGFSVVERLSLPLGAIDLPLTLMSRGIELPRGLQRR
jgi:GNAT superfamily N-acetyltransferase